MTALVDQLGRFFTYYNLIFIGEGFLYTIGLSAAGCGIGYVVGFLLAVLRNERIVRWAFVRWLVVLYVEIFRRIPFLVMLLVVFFAYQYAGADVPMFTIAATTLALHASAYSAEIVRAGLESVHPNQWDAAETMNMGGLAALRRVILPQSWVVLIPPAMTFSVGLIKSTSIASQVGALELTTVAKILNSKGLSAGMCYGTILVLYFVLCYSLTRFAKYLEVRLVTSRR